MAQTFATASQIRFDSSRTGSIDLDAYLEAAERGDRTLSSLLSDLFDTLGNLRPDFVQFQLGTNNVLQIKTGPSATWQDTSITLFQDKGNWLPNTQYPALCLITNNSSKYLAKNAFTSDNTFNTTHLITIYDHTDAAAQVTLAQQHSIESQGYANQSLGHANDAADSASLAFSRLTSASAAAASAAASASDAAGQAVVAEDWALHNANSAKAKADIATAQADIATAKAGEATNSASLAETYKVAAESAKATAQAMATLVTTQLHAAIYISNAPPLNPQPNDLWLDIS